MVQPTKTMVHDAPIFIVIPVHNRKGYTKECLESLKKQTTHNFAITVVDDGSTDGTSEMIQQEFPEVILLHGDGNLFWTKATNLGVKCALEHGARHVMTLNDDTVAAKDFVEKMILWAKREPKSLLGALAFDAETKKPVYGGEIINWKTASSTYLLNILRAEDWHSLHEVTHFPGRGLLVPSEVFLKIGLFDAEHFRHYSADYDFTHRAIKAGYKVFCNYDAKLYVYPQASGDAQFRMKKNLKNYYYHLFAVKGGGNLKRFTVYVVRNCPVRYRPWFLLRGYIQRVFGYWTDFVLEKIQMVREKATGQKCV
jgi:GT2 family glycosyltransferase